jgi:hypothetical protein
MTVWCVFACVDQAADLCGVFSSRALAEAYVDGRAHHPTLGSAYDWFIQEWAIDGEEVGRMILYWEYMATRPV